MDERPGARGEGALPAPRPVLRGDRTPSLAARLDAWLADARVEGSADARARERWLQTAAAADATFAGVLLDLAERGTGVAVTTTTPRRHHGFVEVIGADFVALQPASGGEVLVALGAISSVRTAPSVEPTVGQRVATTDLRLSEVLAELAVERPPVVVASGGGEAVAGTLRLVGHDVVTLRTGGDAPGTAYVPIARILEVALG